MIKELRLINFRNFGEIKIDSINEENFIIGENGRGKTNILESISLLGNNSILGVSLELLIKKGENNFFIEYLNDTGNKVSFSCIKNIDKNGKTEIKKNFLYNNKKVSKKKFNELTYKCVIFSPILMNIMYLSPNLRRDFLDNLLKNSFEEYDNLLSSYKKILKNRNKVLKYIYDSKCSKEEIKFWNESFIEKATQIYKYRYKVINFFKGSISTTLEYFGGKIENIEFKYITKVSEDNSEKNIKKYIEKNFERDIILGRTPIGPHVDDFDIIVDGIPLIDFASRGETKSIIIWLKLLEGIFIEKMTKKKPLLIIDDLISELDEKHKDILIKKIKYYQTFISTINKKDIKSNKSVLSNIITI